MELIEAVNALLALTTAATNAATNIASVSAVIQAATAQGRTTLTPEEAATIKGLDDTARAQLLAALNARLG